MRNDGTNNNPTQVNPFQINLQKEVAELAYWFWEQRGSPIGSPEVDWFRAVNEFNALINSEMTTISAVKLEPDTRS
jgi:hypothetical protein